MKKTLRMVGSLLRTPIGRRRILRGILFRSGPVLGLAAAFLRCTVLRRPRLVAVVGSFGKTTATRAAMAALGLRAERHRGWNAGGFVAARILRLTPFTRHAVLETGISGPGTMERYARWIRPNTVVVTSIGSEHHTSLGSLEMTRHEKAYMVRALRPSGLAVLNGDDENVCWMAGQTNARVVTYGFGKANDIRASDLSLRADGGTRFRLHTAQGSRQVEARLVGRPMVYPLLAAVAVGLAEGVPLDRIISRLGRLPASPERLQPVPTPSGALILLDTVKSFRETVYVGLDVLDGMPSVRKIVVMGDIEEPDGPQGPLYKTLGRRLARTADAVVYVGGRKPFASVASGAAAAGLPREHLTYVGRDVLDAAQVLRDTLRSGDVVWIKGRSTQHLGRIGLALAGRDVRCRSLSCPVTPGCESCVMLER